MPTSTHTRDARAGAYKGAVLLAALGADAAAPVLKCLARDEAQAVLEEMARLRSITQEERDVILQDLERHMADEADRVPAGPEFARRIAEQALGPEGAADVLQRALPDQQQGGLSRILETASTDTLAGLMAEEHPQVIALLAGQLTVERAAAFLGALPEALRGPVAARLAEMEPPAPAALRHLERCLREKLHGTEAGETAEGPGGPQRVADILGRLRRSTEEEVLASLEQASPTAAQKVSRYRFTFEDLLALDDRSLQRVLRDAEGDTLPMVMRGLDEERQQVIYRNMSERAADRLREDLAAMAPVRVRAVEEAQQKLVALARSLQEQGEITMPATGAGAEAEEEEAFV